MFERHIATFGRRVALVGAIALVPSLLVSNPSVVLGADACHVTNVTQGTSGSQLKAMTDAAVDGDQLRLRGTCTGGAVIAADVTITGADDTATITGRKSVRALKVREGAAVTLRQLIIQRGTAQDGGGIYNQGTLHLIGVTVRHNTAAFGAGIYSNGRLTIADSHISSNTARRYGGGMNVSGKILVTNTLIRGNTARDGGGILNAGSLVVKDSTVSANVGTHVGGGISDYYDEEFTYGNVRLVNSHVVSNHAGQHGAGASIQGGWLKVFVGSTISGNVSGAHGGGVWLNFDGSDNQAQVFVDSSSSVTGNQPENCFDNQTFSACL